MKKKILLAGLLILGIALSGCVLPGSFQPPEIECPPQGGVEITDEMRSCFFDFDCKPSSCGKCLNEPAFNYIEDYKTICGVGFLCGGTPKSCSCIDGLCEVKEPSITLS